MEVTLRSDLDRLEDSAAKFYKAADDDQLGHISESDQQKALQTASDLRGAVMDISNLRDKVASLEAALKLANRFADPIKEILKAELIDNTHLNDLEGRIEALEDSNNRDDETRDTIRDMIRDGDITATIGLA